MRTTSLTQVWRVERVLTRRSRSRCQEGSALPRRVEMAQSREEYRIRAQADGYRKRGMASPNNYFRGDGAP